MSTTEKREYWDIDLKNQSRKRLQIFQAGMQKFGGIIHDSYEDKYFSGKLAWRNPILHRISLPRGDRFPFILFTHLWVAHPPRISIGLLVQPSSIPLRGNHDNSLSRIRRSYGFPTRSGREWIRNHLPSGERQWIEEPGIIQAVMDGDLERFLAVEKL
jgi:hypothetical protein